MFIVVSSVDSWGLLFCCRYGFIWCLEKLEGWTGIGCLDLEVYVFISTFKTMFCVIWTCYVIFWNKGLCWIVGLFFC
ncbi:hypothetical protein HanXRQr2_Chr17g0800011 [Helianthus annuus]|uniref:Uncharacterized protein n=1 Tax=Helianthus annuus TaxID=4232 RepID=A0A9K3GTU3_HELAN|nr:hypothetical protein HanXRQr2_Chr17g0800011 [Helianthus annuus]KAJ0428953.1 hypothetical protein HanHA300_Chr17g0651841 [Helianthus annuus]KAJ0632427.1 hypothetical protein HanLR1_Chr17g0665011 [Helianthus annuus]KAJ0812931.1 hypothetical protein HanPSC8_Chr17g0767611 [Helianthus annuus]